MKVRVTDYGCKITPTGWEYEMVTVDTGRSDAHPFGGTSATVNWSCIGSVTPDDAIVMARALLKGAKLAKDAEAKRKADQYRAVSGPNTPVGQMSGSGLDPGHAPHNLRNQ